jgi:diacylglycerol kinase (ATP)
VGALDSVTGRLSSDRTTVLILANPRAGSVSSASAIDSLVRRLRWFGMDPKVSWHPRELEQAAVDSAGLRCVVAAGGDGTVLEVLRRVPDVPIAILPLGTENLLARHIGLNRNARAVAGVIAAGRTTTIDLGKANGRTFALMASAGLDAEIVHRLHANRRGHITHFSYGVPLVRSFRDYAFPPIEIEVMDSGERLCGALALVFNVPRYGLGLPLAPHGRANDGLLDLYLFEKPGLIALAKYAVAVLRGGYSERGDVYHRQAKGYRLHSTHPVPVQTDGDPCGQLPITLEVVPRSQTLVVPNPDAPVRG